MHPLVPYLLGEAHHRLGLRIELARDLRHDRHVAHEHQRPHEARQDAGHEQLGNGLVDGHAVDDQRQRRRDHQAQRRGAGQGADDHLLGVLALAELRDRHLADRRQGRRRGTRHRGEHRAADDVGVDQAARQARQPGRQAAEHVLGQPGPVEDLAHPDEQRQRRQRPRRRRPPDGGDHGVAGRPGGEHFHADEGDAQERQADPDAGAQHQEQHEQEDDDQLELFHGPYSPWLWSTTSASIRWSPETSTWIRWSVSAMAKTTDPMTMADWGIQIGLASWPWLMSLNFHDQ